MHIKGRGGVKGAVRCIYTQLDKYKFAARLDIKSYYSSINHDVLMNILSSFELEADLLNIVLQYLKVPVEAGFKPTSTGIVAGGALSPFLGAVYLSPLDYAMEKLCRKKKIFYIRYMDDLERWIIYFRGGLKGMVQIKSIKKIELFIDYNFKIPYKSNYR